ncbi:MAG: NAD(P)-binding domain-containing protein, partial [Proteobacteria bacterium]|nr:NAD(P)-binding domain-containing protein [Pseudomonadota bacterium]
GIFDRKRHQIDHKWQWTPFRELWKTRWLIVGFGNIGREIAKRVRAFDCEVVGLRRSIEGHPLADTIATLDQLDEHLPQADVVVLACPLDEKTEGLADKAFFQRMKKGAAFVNIARGKIVNQPALIEGLAEGTPGHAILDVFDPEPLPPDSPLWDMDNVIISPHSSNSGSGLVQRGDILFLENLRRFLADQPLLDEAQG